MKEPNRIKNLLIARLRDKGLERTLIPGFIRSLANSVFFGPHINLWQINDRLRFLGWEEFKLDYHTLELALACFEAEGLFTLEHVQGFWFETFDAIPPKEINRRILKEKIGLPQ